MRLEDRIEEPEEEELPPEIIRDSDLTQRSKCGYYYFNLKHVGVNNIPNSAYASMALFFQIQRKKLYEKKGKSKLFPRQKLFGDDTLPYELMGEKDLRENLAFKSPKSFGAAMAQRWMMSTRGNKYAGKQINWGFDGQAHNASQKLMQAASAYYRFVLNNGAPITGFMSPHPFVTPIDLGDEVRKIAVRIPEMRAKEGKVYIDDPTIWGFNTDFPDPEKKPDLETNALVTLRIMAIDYLIRNKELFRLKARLNSVPDDLNYIIYRHFNATEEKITETKRTWLDVERVKSGIKTFIARRGDYTPDHRFCPACPLNTVMKSGEIACRNRRSGIKPTVPTYYFRKGSFTITEQKMEERPGIIFTAYIHETNPTESPIGSRVKVAQMHIPLIQGQNEIIARPHYRSDIRGIEFETRMLTHMNEALDQIATEKAMPVRCEINFQRDFEKTHGVREVRSLLSEMKYEGMVRTYEPFSKV